MVFDERMDLESSARVGSRLRFPVSWQTMATAVSGSTWRSAPGQILVRAEPKVYWDSRRYRKTAPTTSKNTALSPPRSRRFSALTAFPAMGCVSLPFATKEVLQDLAAFGFPDTGGNQTGMV